MENKTAFTYFRKWQKLTRNQQELVDKINDKKIKPGDTLELKLTKPHYAVRTYFGALDLKDVNITNADVPRLQHIVGIYLFSKKKIYKKYHHPHLVLKSTSDQDTYIVPVGAIQYCTNKNRRL